MRSSQGIDLIRNGIQRLTSAGIDDARRNVEWMLCELLSCNRASLYGLSELELSAELLERFEEMLDRRAAREPLQYILGHAEFYGLRLIVDRNVLIPRPETEQVVEHALELIRGVVTPRILDIGTGSGCIALAIAHMRPEAHVAACDVSPEALRIARKNADRLGLEVDLFQADVLRDTMAEHTGLDLVISNPPYVTPGEASTLQEEVVAHEPHLALFSNQDPLQFYRAIAKLARKLLAPGGRLVFETHADYAGAVSHLLTESDYESASVLTDLAGRPRIVSAWKSEASG